MLRFTRMALGLVLILSISGREARAQWGYGGWGYGGWGVGSPQSTALQGAGYYAMGAGIYNYDTAMANNINAQTAVYLNNAWAQATHEDAMIHAARVHKEFLRDQSLYDAHQKMLRDNPGQHELENGDALNAAVMDLSDPRLGSSAIRATKAMVPASLIAEVPFQNASERVTFVLDKLRGAAKWPKAFETPRFAKDKELFNDLVARIRHEDIEGDVSVKTLTEARALIKDLRSKLAAQPLEDEDDQKAALKFINSSSALVGLLDKPDIRPALAELKKVQDTSLGNLLGFMHAFNLRFGAATTQKEKQAYQQLYGILDQTRDQILSEAKLEPRTKSAGNPSIASDFYQSFDDSKARHGRMNEPPRAPASN
ncbi:MAG: hypothetical protein ACLQGP_05375 [Isosphaeraceae bacterium]